MEADEPNRVGHHGERGEAGTRPAPIPWSDEQLRELAVDVLRNSPFMQFMRDRERQERWGPQPRTVLFRCGPQCRRHYCGCGTRVDTGDPRLCTPEDQGVRCFDCARGPAITITREMRYASYVEFGRRP